MLLWEVQPPTNGAFNMVFKHIKGLGPAKQEKLAASGVTDMRSLAAADVDAVAKKSGLKAADIKAWKEEAVGMNLIEDVKGIGPATVRTLAQAGVKSLKDLYDASSEFIAAEAKVAQDKAAKWQAEAKVLATRVAEDAKTSEGRKKLAGEAKNVAVAAAKKTEETGKDIFARVKHDGEAAVAKAMELKDSAPAALQDYRQKAEDALKAAETQVKGLKDKTPDAVKDATAKAGAAIKDAQAKVNELKTKTEEFVKIEGEKLKAANEGFFARIKAKFSKSS